MSDIFPNEINLGSTLKIPKKSDVGPKARRLGVGYSDEFGSQATYVADRSFLKQPPLEQIDLIQDLMADLENLRRIALREFAQLLEKTKPSASEAIALTKFCKVCNDIGIHQPSDLEALLMFAAKSEANPSAKKPKPKP